MTAVSFLHSNHNQSQNFAYNQRQIGFTKIIVIGGKHLLRNINQNHKKNTLYCFVDGAL